MQSLARSTTFLGISWAGNELVKAEISSDIEFSSADVPVRMKVGDGGTFFFQKYENDEWVGATISLDDQ